MVLRLAAREGRARMEGTRQDVARGDRALERGALCCCGRWEDELEGYGLFDLDLTVPTDGGMDGCGLVDLGNEVGRLVGSVLDPRRVAPLEGLGARLGFGLDRFG